MTAETASSDVDQPNEAHDGSNVVRIHLITATVFLILGSLVALVVALQLVLPNLTGDVAFLTYGKLAPVSRTLLGQGWLTLGLLGAIYYVLPRVTGNGLRRSTLALASLALIVVGVVGGSLGILLGFQSGLSGQETPIWARAILVLGYLLAALSVVGTARTNGDRLGATGWYLTAAPIWLTLSAIVGTIPTAAGMPGPIQIAFANAGFIGLWFITAAVGLLYYVFTTLSNTDPTESRPLSALGFWSLTFVWANMAAVALVYTPSPDWYETIAVAFAIGSLVPLFTITGDIALMIRGRIADIGDRQTLRYAVVGALSLATLTVVNLLWAWRATSAIVQYSTWVNAVWSLVILGGGSYAVFAIVSMMRGGSSGDRSFHQWASTMGLVVIFIGLAVGGVVVGFSWAAGPATQAYANAGAAWEITTTSATPFLWITALGLAIYAIGQFGFAFGMRGKDDPDAQETPEAVEVFDLQFEGATRYASWGRLMWGTAGVWLFALFMTLVLPIADNADRDSTLLADNSRTYASGSDAAIGRALFISEGCTECHTQVVRPIGTDVGLGPVSIAGDYANENPVLLGAYRLGPDLMHFASRGDFFDRVLVQAAIQDPRALNEWSTMPGYSYLSSEDLGALVAYLETLR